MLIILVELANLVQALPAANVRLVAYGSLVGCLSSCGFPLNMRTGYICRFVVIYFTSKPFLIPSIYRLGSSSNHFLNPE